MQRRMILNFGVLYLGWPNRFGFSGNSSLNQRKGCSHFFFVRDCSSNMQSSETRLRSGSTVESALCEKKNNIQAFSKVPFSPFNTTI